jgi:hypothetical protein
VNFMEGEVQFELADASQKPAWKAFKVWDTR